MRKIRTYTDKLTLQEKEVTETIKKFLAEGNKNRALIHLKKKKFVGKEIEKAQGATLML